MNSTPTADKRLEELAQHLFDVMTRFCLAVPRNRRRTGELKEIEFLTLSLLHQHESLIVGEIQRQLGILPAQMSRIIRALETREKPLISCRINSTDKRKIDVILTHEGLEAFKEYQMLRVQTISSILERLDRDDREQLNRLVKRLREVMREPLVAVNLDV
ncbi:MAG: MarR family transcriptional regulator [Gemmataceae bacterium]